MLLFFGRKKKKEKQKFHSKKHHRNIAFRYHFLSRIPAGRLEKDPQQCVAAVPGTMHIPLHAECFVAKIHAFGRLKFCKETASCHRQMQRQRMVHRLWETCF